MRELSLNNCRLDKRYDVREQLGRGSYAEIFLATDTVASTRSPHRTVVIKALNVFLQDDLDSDLERTLVENFQNEAIALDRVRHPNIISRIGHGTARDLSGTVFHYLVLEYLSGGDMQSLLRGQKVPIDSCFNYIEQICAGLSYAHRHSIIHRDIKPQNLFLTSDLSTVKIADFGVARVNQSDSPITRVGTNIYAPPEHSPLSAGQTGLLDFAQLTPAADIYSLAKTVYAMITGESPRSFSNNPIADIPSTTQDELWGGELLRVLRRATDEDSRKRHQTVEEFWIDLSVVRESIGNGEFSTVISPTGEIPQPHVSRGYTPIPPELPRFDEVKPQPIGYMPPLSTGDSEHSPATRVWGPLINETQTDRALETAPLVQPKQKRRRFRRFAAFVIFICLFTGILYGTASFIRSRTFLSDIGNPFKRQIGLATTDIYLRPTPNTDNEPIGLVTKNSKVRIVNSQNNWYQVDVVEQGRNRMSPVNASRGWLNGKYLEISDN